MTNFEIALKEFKVASWSSITVYLTTKLGIQLKSFLSESKNVADLGIVHVSEIQKHGESFNLDEFKQISFILKSQTDFIDFSK
jgi:hypothetical protein